MRAGKHLRAAFVALSLVGAGVGTSPATAQVSVSADPDLMVLEMQILQDEIIRGNLEAYDLLQPSLLVLGRRFLTVDPQVWEIPKQANAAVAFMLSGGSGSVFQQLASQGIVFNTDQNLFAGAMAYSQGNRQAAKNLLLKVDVHRLPSGLAGQVALAQGILLSANKPEEANKRFDLARLLMPGTLVEESALRRQVPLAARLGNHDKFERLAQRYLFQYPDSVFAPDFRDKMAATMSTPYYLQRESDWEKVFQLLADFDEDSRRHVLLTLSRAALVSGNTEFASKAGKVIKDMESTSEEEHLKADLFIAASLASTEDWRDALNGIGQLDYWSLSHENQVLADAATRVANSIRDWPTPQIEQASMFAPHLSQAVLKRNGVDMSVLAQAQASLDSANTTLKDAEF
ncbi:hypothetical protein PUV47_03695 [Pseudovibrio exalbescens]|uniref:hypothetical protein n=1 Tax=Pseudovibrio exalbescens TaxID=197461 RepID=UPI00236519F9|nr:hypothetical protein [Pseudovibrio exalbescens]MDD7909006.1 hypothetical protein [Pseudovibrio exalbescens]